MLIAPREGGKARLIHINGLMKKTGALSEKTQTFRVFLTVLFARWFFDDTLIRNPT
jgi:hypothetical protein